MAWSVCAVGVVVMGQGLEGGVRSGRSSASSVSSVGCGGWCAVVRRLEYHGCGGVASRVRVVTGGGMDSGYSALPWVAREDGHVMLPSFL